MSSSRGNFSNEGEPRGNIWSAGSRGGRGNFSRSDNDENRFSRGRGPYRGTYQNNFSRRGASAGNYGFQRNQENPQAEDQIELMKDVIFIQNLPKNVTRDDIHEAFSSVGPIKVNEKTGGPRIWIYKDRNTGEGNGRATVTYEDEETTQKAISEYNDQHISSLNAVVRVQFAQRRNPRNNYRGFRGGGGGRGRGRDNFRPNFGRFNRGYSRGGPAASASY